MTTFHPARTVASRDSLAAVPATTTRIAAVDRMARGGHVVSRIGPVRLPDRASVVDALFRILDAGPEARLGLTADNRSRNWRYDPSSLRELSERMVVEEDGLGDLPAGAALERLTTRIAPGLAVAVVLSGDYLLFVYDHGVVDGRFTTSLPGMLLAVAAGDELPAWLGEPVSRHPVTAGLMTTFVRKPKRIRALLDARQPAPARPSVVDAPAAAPVPWQGSTAVEWASGDPAGFRDLRKWMRGVDPKMPFGAAILVMMRRALAAQGVMVADDSDMIYDVRNFLPAGVNTHGNFITGIPVTGGDDVDAVAKSLRATSDSARPLAALAAGVLKETLWPHRSTASPTVTARPRARIVLSNVGVSRPIDGLPWLDDGRPREAAYAVHPIAPEHVALQFLIVRGSFQLTVSFNDNVFDRAAIVRALAHVTRDPLSLLEAAG